MEFTLTEPQRELKAAARHYLQRRYPPARIAELADGPGHDRTAWPELVRQGWLDPELGLVELAALAEESGRALHPVPWWATAGMALPVYRAAGTALPGPATLADGTATCRASPDGGRWRLDGQVPEVVAAGAATEIVVAASTGTGTGLFGVDPQAPGVATTAYPGVDPLRGSADLALARAPARQLVGAPGGAGVLAGAGQCATALLACEAVGVGDRALELSVAHAGSRVQFGRPIGSYQAVAHPLADTYAELELARSLAYRAACVLTERPAAGPATGNGEEVTEALACAVHAATAAAVHACEVAIQVAGGIGVTWEFPLHRWYRRALWILAYVAGQPDPLATLADYLLGPADRKPEPCR